MRIELHQITVRNLADACRLSLATPFTAWERLGKRIDAVHGVIEREARERAGSNISNLNHELKHVATLKHNFAKT